MAYNYNPNSQAGPFWDFIRSMSEQHSNNNQGEGVDRAPGFGPWSGQPPMPPQHSGPPGLPPRPEPMNPMDFFNPFAFAFGPQGWGQGHAGRGGHGGRHHGGPFGGPRGRHARQHEDEPAVDAEFGEAAASGEDRRRGPPPFGAPFGGPFFGGRGERGHYGPHEHRRRGPHGRRSHSPDDEQTLNNDMENMDITEKKGTDEKVENEKESHKETDNARSGNESDSPRGPRRCGGRARGRCSPGSPGSQGSAGSAGSAGSPHRGIHRGPHRGPYPFDFHGPRRGHGPHGPHGHPGRRGPHGPRGVPHFRAHGHHHGPPNHNSGAPFDMNAFLASIAAHPLAQAWLPPHIYEQLQRSATANATEPNNAADAAAEGTPGVDVPFSPPTDIYRSRTAYTLHVALPGAQKEDVGVNWDADTSSITIAGVVYRRGGSDWEGSSSSNNTTTNERTTPGSLVSSERTLGFFERSIVLGEEADGADDAELIVDGEGIVAKLEDGVLVVTVPRVQRGGWTEVRKVDVE